MLLNIHPWRSTWNIIMEVWFRSFSFLNGWFVGSIWFHVNLPGCINNKKSLPASEQWDSLTSCLRTTTEVVSNREMPPEIGSLSARPLVGVFRFWNVRATVLDRLPRPKKHTLEKKTSANHSSTKQMTNCMYNVSIYKCICTEITSKWQLTYIHYVYHMYHDMHIK